MFQQIPVNDGNIVAYRISGKLSHADYQAFLPQIETLLEEEEKLSLFLELDNFKGWDLKAFLDDFKFEQKYADKLDRIAVVGNHSWEKWMTRLAQPFVSSEIRYFNQDQLIEAWDWLRKRDEKAIEKDHPLNHYQHILLATDLSEHGFRVAQRAKELCEFYQAKLSVIHVYEAMYMYGDFYDDYYDTFSVDLYEQDLELQKYSEQKLKDFMARLDMPSAHSEIIQGTPTASILSYAESQQIDLIVIGKHGHKGIDRLLGSTASGVVHKSRCEVLTIPQNFR